MRPHHLLLILLHLPVDLLEADGGSCFPLGRRNSHRFFENTTRYGPLIGGLYGNQKGGYIVVQPTVNSGTLVMEAKTTGEPPCREPYSSVYVLLEELNVKICKTYFVPSRETFDQGNWVNSLSPGD